MDPYIVFIIALPIAGLLAAIIMAGITPREASPHRNGNVPPRPTGLPR